MRITQQIAKHFRDLHFGGNWTGVDLKEKLNGVTWQQATAHIYSLNTIAALVFHMNYYVATILKVLRGGPLDAHDKFSYDLQPIRSQEDWDTLVEKTWIDAEDLAAAIEVFPEEKLFDDFTDKKYGNYLRNFLGVIEHSHYHLGQISLIKKILLETAAS